MKAIEIANIPLPKLFEKANSANNTSPSVSDTNPNWKNGSKYVLTFDYDKDTVTAKWSSSKMKKKCPEFPPHILDGLFKKFHGYNHGSVGKRIKSIEGFTEYRLTNDGKESFLIRACPNYRNEGHWFDWVKVSWEEEGLLECQCLLFIDFETIIMEEFDMNTYQFEGMKESHKQISCGKAILLHSIQHEDSPSFKRECLRSSYPKLKTSTRNSQNGVKETLYVENRLVKFCEMEETYQIVPIETIFSTCFAIPYEHHNKDEIYLPGCSKAVMIITPMNLWHKFFIDYYDKDLMKEGMKKRDDDFDVNNERFPFEG